MQILSPAAILGSMVLCGCGHMNVNQDASPSRQVGEIRQTTPEDPDAVLYPPHPLPPGSIGEFTPPEPDQKR